MIWWALLACGLGEPAMPGDTEAAAAQSASAQPSEAEPSDAAEAPMDALLDGPNQALVQAHCTVCHGAALIRGQHLSRARWDALITWMQEEQGLWKLPDDVRGQILDYLVATQGPGDGERVADLPWATGRYPVNPL